MKIGGDLEGRRLGAISHPQVLTSKNKRKKLTNGLFWFVLARSPSFAVVDIQSK